ncbi:MAG: hypothetical protein AAGA18_03260 [Verrucomicrobiota bacterium]
MSSLVDKRNKNKSNKPLRRNPWLILGITILLLATGISFYFANSFSPESFITNAAKQLGYDIAIDSVEITSGFHEMIVHNIKIEQFASVDRASIKWKYNGLIKGEIEEIRVYGAKTWLSKLEEFQESKDNKIKDSQANQKKTELNVLLKKLVIGQVQVLIDNLSPDKSPITINIADTDAIILENVRLGSSDPQINQTLYTENIENFAIYSPHNSFRKVLNIERIQLAFSLEGLMQKQFDLIAIQQPQIYVGEDLFWLIDVIQKKPKKQSVQEEKLPWSIANFKVEGGRLILTTFGRPGITLPFVFNTEASGLVLDNFSELPLSSNFKIPLSNQSYPNYGLQLLGLEGHLYFSLPLEEANTDNIVPSIRINTVLWKEIPVNNIDLGLTFDAKGIYGSLYGELNKGYAQGGFSVKLDTDFPWNAWMSTFDINLKPITELLSPEDFLMDGLVQSTFTVDGRNTKIRQLSGDIKLNQPGKLTISSVDKLLEKLPEDFSPTKRQLSEVILKAFRDYDYTQGSCEFNYHPPKSKLSLRLDGLQGKRNFDISWLEPDKAEKHPSSTKFTQAKQSK